MAKSEASGVKEHENILLKKGVQVVLAIMSEQARYVATAEASGVNSGLAQVIHRQ